MSLHNTPPANILERIQGRLESLYPGDGAALMKRLEHVLGRYQVSEKHGESPVEMWSTQDAILITYADSILSEDRTPLQALRAFAKTQLKGAVSTIHLLPFSPYSSDDGFSVIDYRQVDPGSGSWADVEALADEFDLMFDLVLNHVSAQSSWFDFYTEHVAPYRDYFIEVSPDEDLSLVTRPRVSPLLTPVQTRDGLRHVWTTFSADQVDLNWTEPNVFFEMLDVLLGYIARGARVVRLDAVAFLWKRIGTTCLHLPETHEVIKALRDIVELVAPRTIILTETNVPHDENISYFGAGDEAHMVYNFSLPPLTLYGLTHGNARALTDWSDTLSAPPEGCSYFNFTASHDGIGVRPLQGILPDEEILRLARTIEERGGMVSYRTLPDGSQSPYELNATYYSALADPEDPKGRLSQDRFFASQVVALSMRGIPGIYIHSLFGSLNDLQGFRESGIARRLNRRKFRDRELDAILNDADCFNAQIFRRYNALLKLRGQQPAFHPDAPQSTLRLDDRLFALRRDAIDGSQTLWSVTNFSPFPVETPAALWTFPDRLWDLISDRPPEIREGQLIVQPYQSMWLTERP